MILIISTLSLFHQFNDDVVWPNGLSFHMLLHGHRLPKPHVVLETLDAILIEEVQPMSLFRL